MTKVGNIYSLFYATVDGQIPTNKLFLDRKGVLSDKHYGKNIERSVLLTSLDSYTLIKNHKINILQGALGENILMDFNPYELTEGTRLRVGTATLEISQHGTLCKGLSKVNSKLPKLLKEGRGIFAKIVTAGSVSVDDNVYLLGK